MPIGVHTSISGGLSKAVDGAVTLGCDTFQFFLHSPRRWQVTGLCETEAETFRKRVRDAGLWPVVAHTSYLINLSSPDKALFERSLKLFMWELEVAETLGVDYVVTHLGSSKGQARGFGASRVIDAFTRVARKMPGLGVEILCENTAGAGSTTGSTLGEIGAIIRELKDAPLKLGLCFDTCHAFAAGYSMRTATDARRIVLEMDKQVGKGKLKLVHLNDSKRELGSGVDRHEHIGKGRIGTAGLKAFLNHPRIRPVPVILETPKKTDGDDRRNLDKVRSMKGKVKTRGPGRCGGKRKAS